MRQGKLLSLVPFKLMKNKDDRFFKITISKRAKINEGAEFMQVRGFDGIITIVEATKYNPMVHKGELLRLKPYKLWSSGRVRQMCFGFRSKLKSGDLFYQEQLSSGEILMIPIGIYKKLRAEFYKQIALTKK